MSLKNQLISNCILKSSWFFEILSLNFLRLRHESRYRFLKGESQDLGKVSIVLPTYNRVDLLFDRAITSVLSQTYQDWELIVVSHGCSDATDERVRHLSTQDSRVKLLRIKREKLGYPSSAENHWLVGPVKPINAGLASVTGLWVARIDDDDVWTNNHLEILLNNLIQSKAEFISSAYEVSDSFGKRIIAPSGSPRIGGVQTWVYRSYLTIFRAHLSSWRKSWNRVNDTDIQERMIKAGVRFVCTDEITATITARPGERFVGSKAYLDNEQIYEKKYRSSN